MLLQNIWRGIVLSILINNFPNSTSTWKITSKLSACFWPTVSVNGQLIEFPLTSAIFVDEIITGYNSQWWVCDIPTLIRFPMCDRKSRVAQADSPLCRNWFICKVCLLADYNPILREGLMLQSAGRQNKHGFPHVVPIPPLGPQMEYYHIPNTYRLKNKVACAYFK